MTPHVSAAIPTAASMIILAITRPPGPPPSLFGSMRSLKSPKPWGGFATRTLTPFSISEGAAFSIALREASSFSPSTMIPTTSDGNSTLVRLPTPRTATPGSPAACIALATDSMPSPTSSVPPGWISSVRRTMPPLLDPKCATLIFFIEGGLAFAVGGKIRDLK